ncbi:MAG: hypothetical protein EP343_25665 [Deltaproteobacteria bacterium]|nr:MAG: hypothetical protein EP343_25665 [Deltaproteobacteria bacterium]
MYRWSALLLFGATFVFMGNAGNPTGGCGGPTACLYNGQWYSQGATFASSDGCNTCSCDGSQVSCTEKACAPQTCGGLAGTQCASDEYCHYEGGHCGAADQTGVCKKKAIPGKYCTSIYDPVCGCDGKSYGNACTAHTVGVSVRHKGVCKWGSCTYNARTYNDGSTFRSKDGCNTCTCSKGNVSCTEKGCQPKTCKYNGAMYNAGEKFPAGDGCNDCSCQSDGTVVCTLAVCGCHHKGQFHKEGATFDAGDGCNQCKCEKGVVSCSAAKCPPPKCGSRGLMACPSGMYCNQPKHCGATDIPGTCEPIPGGCTKNIDWVCGCDNKSYSNSCVASRAGVSVQYKGQCKPDPTSCLYNGKTYSHNDSFPATDGCNKCLCDRGVVLCTQRACSP